MSEHMPAYIITNEDLRWQHASQQTQSKHDVLTVTGSGDQALFYKLNGATNVETFDITPLAGVIQEIKTIAIQMLNRDNYIKLLTDLSGAPRIADADCLRQIFPHLSPRSQELISKHVGRFFCSCKIQRYPQNLPTETEYTQLQRIITGPFKFIETPLDTLHTHLTNQYDIINISNIFDYGTYNSDAKDQIIRSLYAHLKPGGRILYPAQSKSYTFEEDQWKDAKTGKAVVEFITMTNPKTRYEMFIFQRTR